MGTTVDRRPWLPAVLSDAPHDYHRTSVGGLRYVVVEDVEEDVVGLSVASWPAADSEGRLRFSTDDLQNLEATQEAVRARLYRDGARPVRVGDAFAVAAPAETSEVSTLLDVEGLARHLAPDGAAVVDITAEAREVAHLATFAAAVPSLSEEAAAARGVTVDEDDEDPGPPAAVADEAAAEGPPWQLPADLLAAPQAGEFAAACTDDPDTLVYFLLNVGDGDSQVVLLPADPDGRRHLLVVDVATKGKVTDLLDELQKAKLIDDESRISLLVATHPHADHIGGMPHLLRHERHGPRVDELWEPGYYHPSAVYVETMVELERLGRPRGSVVHTQPASGLTRFFDQVRITVLAPGIGLRSRFDTYGTEINDSSLALKIEYPYTRVASVRADEDVRDHDGQTVVRDRRYLRNRPWSLLLGADAQTTAWAQATVDFPELHREHNRTLAAELAESRGPDPLLAHVFKVPHHASKHGVNVELVGRINPTLSLVSCRAGSAYGFPHLLALEALRETRHPIARSGGQRPADHRLGIHYTCAETTDGDGQTAAVGSVAVMLPGKTARAGGRLRMWRFGDGSSGSDKVELAKARRVTAFDTDA